MSAPAIPSGLAFLGPQRFRPTLADAVSTLGIEGDIATVTAGWQERECEVEELHEHLGGRAVNLELHRRADVVFAADPEFAQAHHRRQELFREMQEIYRLRLDAAMDVCLTLLRRPGHARLLAEETQAAIDAVRWLDDAHLVRVRDIHAEFRERWHPAERAAVRKERDAIAGLIAGVSALAIAGGHVAALTNRLRMFDVLSLTGERPVLAWSGGAMAASERIVLFHDHPPHGSGHAQVMDEGLGLTEDMIFLPHVHRRLDLADTVRVGLMARRFDPARCVALEDGATLTWRLNVGWTATPDCQRLTGEGKLVSLTDDIAA